MEFIHIHTEISIKGDILHTVADIPRVEVLHTTAKFY